MNSVTSLEITGAMLSQLSFRTRSETCGALLAAKLLMTDMTTINFFYVLELKSFITEVS